MNARPAQDLMVNAACPRCHRPVRVPQARLADEPRCPACKVPLFPRLPVALDDSSFDAYIGNSSLPVLVDFWAAWCGPCRAFAPVLAQAAAELSPSVLVTKVDTDAARAVAGRFAIRSIPTLVLFHVGREVARQSGSMPIAQLRSWLGSHGVHS